MPNYLSSRFLVRLYDRRIVVGAGGLLLSEIYCTVTLPPPSWPLPPTNEIRN